MLVSPARRRVLAGVVVFALSGCGPVGHAGGGGSGSPAPSGDASQGGTGTGTPAAGRSSAAARTAEPRVAESPAAGECRSGDLRVRQADSGDSGAGHWVISLVFRNVSSHACWMKGYPGVSYVSGDNGHQVGGSARRDADLAPSAARVWLIPNAHAYARLDQTNPTYFPSARCHLTSARGLRVYPPDETAAIYAPGKQLACARHAVDRPRVSAIGKNP